MTDKKEQKKIDEQKSAVNSGQEKNDKEAAKSFVQTAVKPVKVKKKIFKGNRRSSNKNKINKEQEEFEQRVIDIARVTRVMAGGKRMRFRACVAVGNKKGKIAIGLAKGADVTIAITKAVNKAKKDFIQAPIVNNTIPHEIYQKFGAAKILFKPARKGRGIIAGGAVRIVLELTGIKNVTSKILGTNNKVSNVKCTIEALKNLKRVGNKKKEENKKNSDNKNKG